MKKLVICTLLLLVVGVFTSKLTAQELTPKQNKETEKWGYINKQGKLVVPYEYTNAGKFSDGFAAVSKEGKVGYLNKAGKVAVPLIYSMVFPFKDGFAVVITDLKRGLIDKTGKEIIPCLYQKIEPLGDKGFSVVLDSKMGFFDKTGKQLMPFEYTGFAIPEDGDGFFGMYQGRWVKIGVDGKRVNE